MCSAEGAETHHISKFSYITPRFFQSLHLLIRHIFGVRVNSKDHLHCNPEENPQHPIDENADRIREKYDDEEEEHESILLK